MLRILPSLIVLLAAMTAAFGQNASEAATPSNEDGPVRIACVGDSITFGSGLKDRDKESYPAVLQQILGDAAVVRNFGVSGATAQASGDKPYQQQADYKKSLEFQPEIVIIKLGTNDSKPHNWATKERYQQDLADLIKTFQALPSKPNISVCLPVPVWENRFQIREEPLAEGARPAIQELAETHGITVIDLNQPMVDQQELFPDGVHPNAAGARKVAEIVAEALKGIPAVAE